MVLTVFYKPDIQLIIKFNGSLKTVYYKPDKIYFFLL